MATDSSASSKKSPSVHFSDLISSPYITVTVPKQHKGKLEVKVIPSSKERQALGEILLSVPLHNPSKFTVKTTLLSAIIRPDVRHGSDSLMLNSDGHLGCTD